MAEQRQNFKLYVVGDGKVGKTSLFITFTTGNFPTGFLPPSFHTSFCDVVVKNEALTLHMFDVAGGEDFDRWRPRGYPKTNIFLLCFSLDSRSSFEHAKSKWYPELKHHCPNVPILLVGTKLDLRENQGVISQLEEKKQVLLSRADGLRLANEIQAANYLECSSLLQEGVKEVFDEAVKIVWAQMKS